MINETRKKLKKKKEKERKRHPLANSYLQKKKKKINSKQSWHKPHLPSPLCPISHRRKGLFTLPFSFSSYSTSCLISFFDFFCVKKEALLSIIPPLPPCRVHQLQQHTTFHSHLNYHQPQAWAFNDIAQGNPHHPDDDDDDYDAVAGRTHYDAMVAADRTPNVRRRRRRHMTVAVVLHIHHPHRRIVADVRRRRTVVGRADRTDGRRVEPVAHSCAGRRVSHMK